MSSHFGASRSCTRCGETKALESFGPCKGRKDGLHSWCRPCIAEANRLKRAERPDHYRSLARARYAQEPDKFRSDSLRRRYGISRIDYENMLETQQGRCAVCLADNPGFQHRHFAVDHCHTTGQVRGLLCHPCNTGLGKFKDSPSVLLSAARYLQDRSQ